MSSQISTKTSSDASVTRLPGLQGTIPRSDTPKTVGEQIKNLFSGDIGQLPVLAALLVIVIYFQSDSQGLFLSARNISNLALQGTNIALIALAATMVLLLGEIDLSLAAVSSLCGGVMVVASATNHTSPFVAIMEAILIGAVIGFVNGFIIAVIRVPAFIVTLAGLIGYQGVLLHLLGANQTIRLTDPFLTGIASKYLPDYLGIGIPIAAVVIYAGVTAVFRLQRQSQGLYVPPLWQTGLRVATVAALLLIASYEFQGYLGIPLSAMIMIGLVTLMWLVMKFTAFGRFVYAVGGNAEASRRAGINVVGIKIAIFMLASVFAAIAGVLESSREISASPQISATLLLNSIAAAVIGGVSLFGGRGSVWAVVLGTLVIAGLINGLQLQGRPEELQEIIEGLVLVLAVIVDAILRRRNAVQGR